MRDFGIILQARSASKRFPKKIYKQINKKSILEILLERVRKIKTLKIIVATTIYSRDDKITKLSNKMGVLNFRGREKDVLSRYYFCAKKYKLKHIIRLTGDCPLIDPGLIKKMIKIYKKTKIDYLSNTVPINKSRYPNGSDIEIFSMDALKKNFQNCKSKFDREHVTNFFYKKKSFKIKILKPKFDFSNYRYTLDFPKDLLNIKRIYNHLNKKKLSGTTNQIVSFLKNNKTL
tara:strand:- start:107 stop:802 length:696 start_codon:yes stop_codon:yes gene_type:complete